MRAPVVRGVLALALGLAGPVVAGAGPAGASDGRITRVTVSTGGREAAGPLFGFAISGNGRYVVFGSAAPNLVPGDTNDVTDIFLRDRWAGTTVSPTSSSWTADPAARRSVTAERLLERGHVGLREHHGGQRVTVRAEVATRGRAAVTASATASRSTR